MKVIFEIQVQLVDKRLKIHQNTSKSFNFQLHFFEKQFGLCKCIDITLDSNDLNGVGEHPLELCRLGSVVQHV